jgi:predicted flap endonuclease-1-like 5' DNA nuclease
MMTQDMWLWIAIAAGLVLLLAAVLFLRRGQRVDLGLTDDAAPTPTLSRQVQSEPVIAGPDPIAASIALAVNAPPSGADDLRLIKGLGPRIATRLNELGITRFEQLAALDAAGVAKIDSQLGTFAGRITRDNWVDQASFLAKGDIAGFEAKYGKLDSGGTPS